MGSDTRVRQNYSSLCINGGDRPAAGGHHRRTKTPKRHHTDSHRLNRGRRNQPESVQRDPAVVDRPRFVETVCQFPILRHPGETAMPTCNVATPVPNRYLGTLITSHSPGATWNQSRGTLQLTAGTSQLQERNGHGNPVNFRFGNPLNSACGHRTSAPRD